MFDTVSACVLCAEAARTTVCEACANTLPRITHACPRCARPLPHAQLCGRCLRKPPVFDRTVAVYAYAFPLDRLIALGKYGGDLPTLAFLGERLATALRHQPVRADAVVPVPLGGARQRQRGYNQAAELAKAVSARLGCPLLSVLVRTRETEKQTELSLKARLRNVRAAFSAASLERPLAGKHVLLIDDVMTTGATLNEAAKALKDSGVARVTVGIVARSVSAALFAG